MKIAITYFPKLRDAQGKRVRTTWAALLERLSHAREVADKHDAPGVSLATYAGDRRALANVEFVYAIGLDLDERVNWDDLTALFDDCDSFLHTTWSSTDEEPRARVFLRLSRPVTGPEYRRVYAAVSERSSGHGLVIDRAASDPSRLWFLPSIPPGGTYRYSIGRGKPVNVDWALATVPEPTPPPPPPSRTHHQSDSNSSQTEERAAAYMERCDPAISGSGGSALTSRIAIKMVRGFGLSVDAALRVMWPWNVRCQPPWTEHELRRKLRWAADNGDMPEGALRDAPMRRAS